MAFVHALQHFDQVLVWGLVATLVMSVLLEGSQRVGLSRMSLPFLFGTVLTANRNWALALGLVLYTLGGWLFAFFYAVAFEALGLASWWLGLLFGLLHGLFLLALFLPAFAGLHPRMATEFDGPTAERRIEPPGFLGLNYGRQTPAMTLVGQAIYGTILGATYAPFPS